MHTERKRIRQSKKRDRPLIWRIIKRALQLAAVVVLLLLAIYTYAAVRLYTGEPDISTNYLDIVTQPARDVAEEDRAWPLYRSALISMRKDIKRPHDVFNSEAKPGTPEWDANEVHLQRHAASFEQLREAAAMPGFGFVPGLGVEEADKELWPNHKVRQQSESDFQAPENIMSAAVLADLLPVQGELRIASYCLLVDANHAAASGDGARAIVDLEACLGMSRHAGETASLVSSLISQSILNNAMKTAARLMSQYPDAFTDEDLLRFSNTLAAIDTSDTLVKAIEFERLATLDMLQRFYTDDGAGDGRFHAEGLEGMCAMIAMVNGGIIDTLVLPAIYLVAPTRREADEQNEQILDFATVRASTPMWDWDPETFDERFDHIAGANFLKSKLSFTVLQAPIVNKAILMNHWLSQEREALLAAIAAVRYEKEQGHWPASLADIPHSILPDTPKDVLTGEPIGYAIVDGNPTIYSVGVNRTDNGGHPVEIVPGLTEDEDARKWIHPFRLADNPDLPEGDWILWRAHPLDSDSGDSNTTD